MLTQNDITEYLKLKQKIKIIANGVLDHYLWEKKDPYRNGWHFEHLSEDGKELIFTYKDGCDILRLPTELLLKGQAL